MKRFLVAASAAFVLAGLGSARAAIICDNDGRCTLRPAPAGHRQLHRRARRPVLDGNGNPAIVTVGTAAGIKIHVAPSFARPIEGFIADLKARGYVPKHIGCYSWGKSHVRHSLHHSGQACDFDQCGWGCAPRIMHHVADLARKWGLRDGCSFGDCGHIDSGSRRARAAYNDHNLYAAVARFRLARPTGIAR